MMKKHSTATLMGMTKSELVEYVRMCEHNREVAEKTLAQHIENVKDWQPVRRGHWVGQPLCGNDNCRCSECGFYANIHVNLGGVVMQKYCCNCGARMDGGAENA